MEAFIKGPVKAGQLKVFAPDNQIHVLEGASEGPRASIRVADRKLLRRMLVMPDLYLGEAYMAGTLTVEEGSLYDVLDFFACNLMPRLHDSHAATRPGTLQNNVIGQAKANVAFHYDLNRELRRSQVRGRASPSGTRGSPVREVRDAEGLEPDEQRSARAVGRRSSPVR